MQKIGIGIVAVGAFAWILTGVVFYASDAVPSVITEVLVEQEARTAMSASALMGLNDGHYGGEQNPTAYSEEAWMNGQAAPVTDTYARAGRVMQKPWYQDVFHGFGSLFAQLFPERIATWDTIASSDAPDVSAYTLGSEDFLEPACVVTIVPNVVPYGGSATLSWTSRNARAVILQGHGEVSLSGSMTVKDLTSTRAYALAVGGRGGSSSCYTVINVDPLVLKKPSCQISANPSAVNAGESVNISWRSENAVAAAIADRPVATIGGMVVAPDTTSSYELTVSSVADRTATCSVEVAVQ